MNRTPMTRTQRAARIATGRAIGTMLGAHYGPEDRNWVRKGKVRVIRRTR